MQITNSPTVARPCYHPLEIGLHRMPKNRSVERIRSGFSQRWTAGFFPDNMFYKVPQRMSKVINLAQIRYSFIR